MFKCQRVDVLMSGKEDITNLTILVDDFPKLDLSDQVGKALPFFEEGYDHFLILEPNKSYYGIVSDRDMLKKHANSSTTLKTLARSIPTLSSVNEDLIKVARLMLDGDSRIIPVLDPHNRVVQVFTDLLLAENMLNEGFEDTTIGTLTDKTPKTCFRDATLGQVVSLVRDQSLSVVPVIDQKNQVEGIITARDLCHEILQPRYATTVGDIAGKREASWVKASIDGLIRDSPSISPDMTCSEAIRVMKDIDIPLLVVTSEDPSEIYLNTISPRDILHYLIMTTIGTGYSVAVSGAPDQFVKDLAIEKAQRLVDHEARFLGETGDINVRFKKAPYQSKRGLWQYECAVRIRSSKGHTLAVENSAFGSEKAMNEAYDKLSRIIRSRKGAAIDSRRKQSRRKVRE